MIVAEYRRTVASDPVTLAWDRPLTIADIVDALPDAEVVRRYGVVYIDSGEVDRALWSLVSPKDGHGVFIAIPPQGGGNGKNIFALIATLALMAIATFISGGGLALLAPSLATTFGTGTFGATVAAALTVTAGGLAIGLLTSVAQPKSSSPGTVTLGTAGISQNAMEPFKTIPKPLGTIRVSPPLLACPFVETIGKDQYINLICGVVGPQHISDILINGVPIDDVQGVSYETREGWASDTPLTLVQTTGMQENVNTRFKGHNVQEDGKSLMVPYSGSYPSPQTVRTASRPTSAQVMLALDGGLTTTGGAAAVTSLRVRIRPDDRVSSWINLPEVLLGGAYLSSQRLALWFHFRTQTSIDQASRDASSIVKATYGANSEWTANSYFNTEGTVPALNPSNLVTKTGSIDFFLDPSNSLFKWRGRWLIELQKGYTGTYSSFSVSEYTYGGVAPGFFTYNTIVAPNVQTIPDQTAYSGDIGLVSYTTFRDEYPLAAKGMALIAIRARNTQVSSISALMTSYVNVWNGTDWNTVAPSNNPAALARHVLTGSDNARAVPTSSLDGTFADFYNSCVSRGYTAGVVTEGTTVEDTATLLASCGHGVIRRSEKWGIILDEDRSGDPLVQHFNPHNLLSSLQIQRSFNDNVTVQSVTYSDEDDNYYTKELLVYDDTYDPTDSTQLTESVTLKGCTDVLQAELMARRAMRKARLRRLLYTVAVRTDFIRCKKGDSVGVAHDVFVEHLGSGRVKSITTGSGSLLTVTLDNEALDYAVPPVYTDFFDVVDMFTLSDVFTLAPPQLSIALQLADGSTMTAGVQSVSGAVITIKTGVAAPAETPVGCIASLGYALQEVRRLIVVGIKPKNDFRATMTLIDEAPGIFI